MGCFEKTTDSFVLTDPTDHRFGYLQEPEEDAGSDEEEKVEAGRKRGHRGTRFCW